MQQLWATGLAKPEKEILQIFHSDGIVLWINHDIGNACLLHKNKLVGNNTVKPVLSGHHI